MRYIRTKDGRIITCGEPTDSGYDKGTMEIQNKPQIVLTLSPFEVLKESHSIEELCDEFVCKLKEIPTTWCSFDLDEIEEGLKTHSLKEWEWFGMIWTDKGLMYIAKMKGVLPNGEIDWELL